MSKERQKQAATKITDYRHYHLSGDLDNSLQGRVGEVIHQFENNMSQSVEDLQREIQEEEEKSKKMQQEAEVLRLKSRLEQERLKQAEWESAIQQLQQARDTREKEHHEAMKRMKDMTKEATDQVSQ